MTFVTPDWRFFNPQITRGGGGVGTREGMFRRNKYLLELTTTYEGTQLAEYSLLNALCPPSLASSPPRTLEKYATVLAGKARNPRVDEHTLNGK